MVRIAGTLVLAVMPIFATALLQMSVEQITTASTEIVQGTVTGSYTAMTGATIFTHYKIQVTQRMKGPANPTTDVAIPGGSFNKLRQSFAGVPVLQVGQQYLLFLWQGASGPNQPVGLNQGIFEIQSNGSDTPMAFRPATGETMLNTARKPVIDRPVRMALSEMNSRIAVTLAKGSGPGAAK